MATKRLLRVTENQDVYMDDPQQKAKQQRIQRKTNFRFVVLFVLFSVFMFIIISRLYSVQILQHDKYSQIAITQFDETRYELPTRGEIVSNNGTLLVSNDQRSSFIYLPPKTDNDKIRMEKAIAFTDTFETDLTTMTIRDKRDAYIHFLPDEANKLITQQENEQYRAGTLTSNDLYRLKLSRITSSLIENSLSEKQLKEFYIFSKMRSGLGLDIVLKESVTFEEISQLLERPQDFAGIEVKANWDRVFLEGHHLNPILGEITTTRQGLLSDNSTSMQALDYKLNDRIGRSGLELQYESILAGVRTQYSLTYSPGGLVELNESFSGRKGDTLRLTLDLDYQYNVEEIIKDYLRNYAYSKDREFFNQMYVVVSDPNTGAVLASVGMQKNLDSENEFTYIPNGTYLNAFLPGSSIKGAVVYLALDEGIFQPGEKVLDEPIKIAGSEVKASSAVLGEINDLEALSKSSNIYMMKTAIALGGGVYEYDKPLDIKQSAFHKVRSNFSQFGLGIQTGLDVPLEEKGYQSNSYLPGHLLDYVIGQYDSYTAMQLNQYVSTIANGQYRYKMRLVSESFDSETQEINFQNPVQILSTIDNAEAISRVQQGFRLCVTDGYCNALNEVPIPVAAKTGSAEDFITIDGTTHKSVTNTIVAYAPFDNPQIAVSCIAPHHVNIAQASQHIKNGCEDVTKAVLNYHASRVQVTPIEVNENE